MWVRVPHTLSEEWVRASDGRQGPRGQHTSFSYIDVSIASHVTLATQPFLRPCLAFSGVASAQVGFKPLNLGFGFWKQLKVPWMSGLRHTLGRRAG